MAQDPSAAPPALRLAMSWVTIVWSMIASACLTLAAMHLLVWARRRTAWAHLLFSLSAAGVAAYAACELRMMRAETPGEFGLALRWAPVPAWVTVVSLVAFARVYLRAGRLWLAWVICGVRTLGLLLNFGPAPNLHFREISSLRRFLFLGDSVAVGEGTRNPWMLVGPLSLLLLVIFVTDASLAAWRRGDRRQALVVGGSLVFFAIGSMVEAGLVLGQVVHAPLTASLVYLGLMAVIGYQLSDDVFRAIQLSDDLRQREQQMALAADLPASASGSGQFRRTRSGRPRSSARCSALRPVSPSRGTRFSRTCIQRIASPHGALYGGRWTKGRSTRPSIVSCFPTAANGGLPRPGAWRGRRKMEWRACWACAWTSPDASTTSSKCCDCGPTWPMSVACPPWPHRPARAPSEARAQGGPPAGARNQRGDDEQALHGSRAIVSADETVHPPLRSYTWVEKTQLSLKGEVKNTKLNSCRYGPDGKIQKTPIGDAPPPPANKPGLRGKVIEKKKEEMKEELQAATALVNQYVPPDPGLIQVVIGAGKASLAQEGPAAVGLKFSDYVKAGDALTLTLDPALKALRKMNVASYMDDPSKPVTLQVDLQSLPDGTNYPATVSMKIPASQIEVRTENSNYQKLAQ
jgi:hypothetical protein